MPNPYQDIYDSPEDHIRALQRENDRLTAQNREYRNKISSPEEYHERWWLSESKHMIELVTCVSFLCALFYHDKITSISAFFIQYGISLVACVIAITATKFIATLPALLIDYDPATPIYQNKTLWIILFLLPLITPLLLFFQSSNID